MKKLITICVLGLALSAGIGALADTPLFPGGDTAKCKVDCRPDPGPQPAPTATPRNDYPGWCPVLTCHTKDGEGNTGESGDPQCHYHYQLC